MLAKNRFEPICDGRHADGCAFAHKNCAYEDILSFQTIQIPINLGVKSEHAPKIRWNINALICHVHAGNSTHDNFKPQNALEI